MPQQQQSPSSCGERDGLHAPRDRSQISARRGIGLWLDRECSQGDVSPREKPDGTNGSYLW